jgi:para-aminobenzoate synthetase/4-amino-4-deoxychorismate lyase
VEQVGFQWFQLPEHWRSTAADAQDSVLLQTSRFSLENRRSFLFLDPVAVFTASQLDEIPALFRQIESALDAGLYVAGYVGYECGYHFQEIEVDLSPSSTPLAWFGAYRSPQIWDHALGSALDEFSQDRPSTTLSGKPDEVLAGLHGDLRLTMEKSEYCARIERIQRYLRAGDTYQVNFTDSVEGRLQSTVAAAFSTLSLRQPVSHGALLRAGALEVLSFSPELFFKVAGDRIVTRPMKGTMPRGLDLAEDAAAALRLQNDEKNRAEHVMIVDLLRNDLGRICEMGSVGVEDLFSVEKYRTLLQMTSTVSGTLRPKLSFYEIFKSLFPCGSITGAPKIRTMQIIRELEDRPRGVYTGAIGYIAPDRSSTFSVAIRTLVVEDGQARMGVGGGIVADSRPMEEYRECLLKASFLSQPPFQLIETMRWEGGFAFLSEHLDRMEQSAAYFEIPFERKAILSRIAEKVQRFVRGQLLRVRILLDSVGEMNLTATPLLHVSSTVRVCLSPERTASDDVFLRHKTTGRERYDRLYAEACAEGFDDVLFLNERDELTEGAISNLFVLKEGRMLTPALNCGVLPGIFRRHLLQTDPTAEERVLTLRDLECAESVLLGNSVRGLRPVTSISFPDQRAQRLPSIGEKSEQLILGTGALNHDRDVMRTLHFYTKYISTK